MGASASVNKIRIHRDDLPAVLKEYVSVEELDFDGNETTSVLDLIHVIERKTDVYICHEMDKSNLRNYNLINNINNVLRAKGLRTWFISIDDIPKNTMDDPEASRRWISKNLDDSRLILVIVTRKYCDYFSDPDATNYFKTEFTSAFHKKSLDLLLSIIIEPNMRDTLYWDGEIGTALSNGSIFDFCDSTDANFNQLSTDLHSTIMYRIKYSIDSLLSSRDYMMDQSAAMEAEQEQQIDKMSSWLTHILANTSVSTSRSSKYIKSAEQGNSYAMFRLGDLYREGDEVEKNHAEAFKLYKMSAELNDPIGMLRLGDAYRDGVGVSVNYEEAIKWYKRSAYLGNNYSQFRIGDAYRDGKGVPQNSVESIKWYRIAAESGLSVAMLRLGDSYSRGFGVPADLEEMFKWYKMSADLGTTIAQFHVGCCYQKGEGVEKNLELAQVWFKKGADQGDASCQWALGDCVKEKDHTAAFELYKFSAEQFHPIGMLRVGDCYKHGFGTAVNLEEAFKNYMESAKSGNAEAQYKAAACYEFGEGVEANLETAIGLYTSSAEQKDILGMLRLGKFCKDVSKNFEAAAKWLRQSAVSNAEAQHLLGDLYKDGIGVEKNLAEAVRLYHLSAASNDSDGQYKYGDCCRDGVNMEPMPEEALKYYKLSANQGNNTGTLRLAMAFKNGIGTLKNYKEAVRLFRYSADHHPLPETQFILGECYREGGLGVPKNLEEALKWYKLAAAQKHVHAAEVIRKIGH